MIEIFNKRELSFIIWGIIVLITISFDSNVRQSIKDLIKSFFQFSIISIIIFAAIYSTTIVFCLHIMDFWDISFLKETIFWFLGVAFIMIMNSTKARHDDYYFKKIFKENLQLILILEFLVTFYVFNFIAELILLPFLALLGIFAGYTSTKSEYKLIQKLMENILSVIGIIFFLIAIYKVVNDFYNFASIETLKSFLLPIILTISFLPFIYLLVLYFTYEAILKQFKIRKQEDEDFLNYAKFKIFWKCNFNLNKLKGISKNVQIITSKTKEELKIELAKY